MSNSTSPDQKSATPYGVLLSKDVMLPMRDGVRLATDVYRPAIDGEAASGQFPVILCRTPYNKSDFRYTEIADFFTPRGYVTILQDLRDRYRSEGRGDYYHTASPHEENDGVDTLAWIAKRPWSNGRVGTVGSSFAAVVQIPLAFAQPPNFTAMWPDVTPISNYQHQAREGGAMQLHMFWAMFMHVQDAQDIRDDEAAKERVWAGLRNMRQYLENMPFTRGSTALAEVPQLEDVLFQYYHRNTYDDFWDAEVNEPARYFNRHADIPATFTGGWFDPYHLAMTEYYAAMAAKNQSVQRLIMGPWTHVGMRGAVSYFGDVDFGPSAIWGVQHYFGQQLQWFDRWLRDLPTGVDQEEPVQIFVMGGGDGHRTAEGKLYHGGQWRREREWPLERTQYATYYFHQDGGLNAEEPAADVAPLEYDFDPSHPVPTIGAASAGLMELPADDDGLDAAWRRFISPVARLRHIMVIGSAHQKETPQTFGARPPYPLLADRPDVLVFQTEALSEDVEITGRAVVKLWVSSSALDTDFTAKLVDVYPPSADYPEGYHMFICDSVLRMRSREGWEKETLMQPGQVYAIEIPLPPTSNLFQAGHRIRIDISSSNFPRLDVNPNTGEPMGRHTHTVVCHNSVYVDAAHPSQVILPIIPR